MSLPHVMSALPAANNNRLLNSQKIAYRLLLMTNNRDEVESPMLNSVLPSICLTYRWGKSDNRNKSQYGFCNYDSKDMCRACWSKRTHENVFCNSSYWCVKNSCVSQTHSFMTIAHSVNKKHNAAQVVCNGYLVKDLNEAITNEPC